MPDKERMFAVLQPTAYRWQNDCDGLQQDDAVAALRASQGSSGFHEMNHPVITQPVPFAIYGGNKRPDRPEGGFYVRQEDTARTLDSSQGLNPTCSQGGTGVLQPVPYDLFQITAPVNRQNRAPGDPCHTLAKDNAAHAAVAFHPTQDPISNTDGSTHCMGTGSSRGDATIAVALTVGNAARGQGPSPSSEVFPTLKSGEGRGLDDQWPSVMTNMTVRRLTPRECERLQGFPDDWTMIPYRGKCPEECPDGPRYKALGNSMACNCMAWIGERIAAYENHNP
jgi:DNA (cytosine-5)-methyltransferase 1